MPPSGASSAPVPGTSSPTPCASRSTPTRSPGSIRPISTTSSSTSTSTPRRPALCRVPIGFHPGFDRHRRRQGRLLSHEPDPVRGRPYHRRRCPHHLHAASRTPRLTGTLASNCTATTQHAQNYNSSCPRLRPTTASTTPRRSTVSTAAAASLPSAASSTPRAPRPLLRRRPPSPTPSGRHGGQAEPRRLRRGCLSHPLHEHVLHLH